MASSKSWVQLTKAEKNFLLLQQNLQRDTLHLHTLTANQKQILIRAVGGTLPRSNFDLPIKNKKD